MKRLELALELALIMLLFPSVVTAQSPEDKGLAIAHEADTRDTSFGDFTANMQMILMNKRGQKSERKIRIRTLE
ncbi:MAG: outer membrane lipoprotein-sorting protein, partial [Planctomycetota bacterium]